MSRPFTPIHKTEGLPQRNSLFNLYILTDRVTNHVLTVIQIQVKNDEERTEER